jgi:ATP-dependent helicase YprA (DUF1998 family)/phage repressor protein C with HTH and peptisase S24 domain
MALNPISYTEKVVQNFLRYQLTRTPFADADLYKQMKELLSLEKTRHTPLLKGPYVSLSRAFRQGASLKSLAAEGLLHPLLPTLVDYPAVYGHQEKALRSILAKNTTLVSTGTGSGKTECFLFPIVSELLKQRDAKESAGIRAIILYPMNALAEDQLGRLREFLAGTGVSFGMYVGKTPDDEANVTGQRLSAGSSRADYKKALEKTREEKRDEAVHPCEEVCSREAMRQAPPRLLITNTKQLELLLTRGKDVELFHGAKLDFLVVDEAHTFTGAGGAETACLIRRLKTLCSSESAQTTCIATSATLGDPESAQETGSAFASRFFGVQAQGVNIIGEEYSEDAWQERRIIPNAMPEPRHETLMQILNALDSEEGSLVASLLQNWVGKAIDASNWATSLYHVLTGNEIAYQLGRLLEKPQKLDDLLEELKTNIQRDISEEEVLAWLALGVAARFEGRSLLRPVMHGFIRGVGGAVVSFSGIQDKAKLWLSPEQHASDIAKRKVQEAHWPVLNCFRCGQHYLEHHLDDFHFEGTLPEGGLVLDKDHRYWRKLDQNLGGCRVLMVDATIGEGDEEEEAVKLAQIHICVMCGTVHSHTEVTCASCGASRTLRPIRIARSAKDEPGKLKRCISCSADGRRNGSKFREPIREIKAVATADVHILAQEMIHHAERKRLLLFTDNRQDAAFQAGWMRDHARKFRLRAMMYRSLESGQSIGDLVGKIDGILDRDDSLSRALVPEVWDEYWKEKAGEQHQKERRKFLRMQVLQEITVAPRIMVGLEPWGRIAIEYLGLTASTPFVVEWADQIGLRPVELCEGIQHMLDTMRRQHHLLFDPIEKIFSKYWMDGDREVQRGYLSIVRGLPCGLRLEKQAKDNARVKTWLTGKANANTIKNMVKMWGVPDEKGEEFLRSLWKLLVEDLHILVPVKLEGAKGKALSDCSGVYQIDADKIRILPHKGYYRCDACHRKHVRQVPHDSCVGWRCKGKMKWIKEDRDSYDLNVLDQDYELIKPREHSAQVPNEERERIENMFKGDSLAINTLVCTPTLEMGVDIGALDTVLMRNVPPHPANYWQRAGRAGRRHRVAVNLTYARPQSHDQIYFADPLKMLRGKVSPPSFGMSNELMVRKHVHATILTVLHRIEDPQLKQVLKASFPTQVRDYLFDELGHIRKTLPTLESLESILRIHSAQIQKSIATVFAEQNWPVDDAEIIRAEKLEQYTAQMVPCLRDVLKTIKKRLDWALNQMRRLDELRKKLGTLEKDDQSTYDRCDRIVKRLKSQSFRGRSEAEGVDDTNTYAVLAAEGFLPGYGLETGSILGTASVPTYIYGAKDYALRRPTGMALREYVPGNMIYANGQRFTPRNYHLEPDAPQLFQIDPANQAVVSVGVVAKDQTQSVGDLTLPAVQICDVELPLVAHIKDDEEFRFRMGVAVYGTELDRHAGGKAFLWGNTELLFRKSTYLRLVNVGPNRNMGDDKKAPGYPLCVVCGASRSPFASDAEITSFIEWHSEHCKKAPRNMGFYADVVVDSIVLKDLPNRETAYSIAEALRMGATELLDMEINDLSILVLPKIGVEKLDVLIYDPMPGGSGLLQQILQEMPSVIQAMRTLLSDCPSVCETACVDCMLTYENSFYHQHLNRKVALDFLIQVGDKLTFSHDIPQKMPASGPSSSELPVNSAEQALRAMLERAGFPEPIWHHRIAIGKPYPHTEPDCFFQGDDPEEKGICIYLDGLSKHLHGNPETKQKDLEIREVLRNLGYEVIAIAATQLLEANTMSSHFYKLGKLLLGKKDAEAIRSSSRDWFVSMDSTQTLEDQKIIKLPFSELASNTKLIPFQNAVPLLSLKAAAGAFGESLDVETLRWVVPETGKRLGPGMFVAKVVGKSMEPKIPNGSYCLFQHGVAGARTGRTLLVQHHSISDPENGGQYTVKIFDSSQIVGKESGEREGRIVLKPLNQDFEPIIIEDGEDLQVIAEMIAVLGVLA